MSDQIKYKVSLTDGCSTVIFEASSPITEGRTANYDGFNIVHLPTDMWSYRNTSARHFGISGKLVSRNASEAAANSYYVDIIRSWILPDFGGSGATPPVLFLSAYNNTNINKVQCILRSYNIMFPDDVDWIFDGSTVNKPKGSQSSAMPVICNIQLDLEESYSPTQITNKKWRINQSTGGSFVIGGSAKDNTPGGGGQQQTVTPDAGVCANNPKFGGIAADSSSDLSSGITNGDMTGIFGLKDSVGLLTTFPKGGVADKLSKMTPSSINGVVLPDVIANTKYVAPLKPDRIAEIANYVKTPSPYDATINAAGAKYNVDPTEIKLKMGLESSGNPNAVSSAGAVGLGQFMPATAAQYGITDRTDPTQSINGIGAFLSAHGGTVGNDMSKADMAYIGSGPDARQYVANTQAVRLTLQQNSPLTTQQSSSLIVPNPTSLNQ